MNLTHIWIYACSICMRGFPSLQLDISWILYNWISDAWTNSHCKCYIWDEFTFIDQQEILERILVKHKLELHLFKCKLQLLFPEIWTCLFSFELLNRLNNISHSLVVFPLFYADLILGAIIYVKRVDWTLAILFWTLLASSL